LFLSFLLFHVIDLLMLLLDGHAVLVRILAHDLLDLGISGNIYDGLALTVLDMDKRAITKQQDLADFEVASLSGNVQGTSTVDLL